MTIQQVEFLIIGGGPGGTPTAMALAAAGKSVMLVEKGPGLGGTCLFEGCIPSKIFRESARRLRELKQAGEFGLCLPTQDVRINWSAVLQRKRSILQHRSEAAQHKTEQLPTLKTVFGHCRLLSSCTAVIESQTDIADSKTLEVHFEKAILATGSVPFIPPIKGSRHPRVHDSESILNIDHIPQRLVIIGGGPIGVELGQVFNTLGSEVSLLETAPHILGSVDEELSRRLQQRMSDDGIDIVTRCNVHAILTTGQNVFVEYTTDDGSKQHKLADTVLMVTGRQPNVDGLGLENTAVQYDKHGMTVNATLETTEADIYAVGDVTGQPMFAHWATAQGLALARHLLAQPVIFPSAETNSAVIFSEPEIGIAGNTDGLLKIIFDVDSRKVVGVHLMVEGAAELMGEAALLVKTGVPLEAIAAAIHPHPTLTESFVMAVHHVMAQGSTQKISKTAGHH